MSNRSSLIQRSVDILRSEGLRAFVARTNSYLKYQFPILESLEYFRVRARHYKHWFQYGSSAPDPYELLRVDASDIEYWVDQTKRSEIDFYKSGTAVSTGEWDRDHLKKNRTRPRFQKLNQSFDQHFIDGLPWEETAIYKYATETPNPHPLYDPDNGLDKRLAQLNELYERLSEDGYRTQRELQDAELLSHRMHDEIPAGHPPEVHEIGIAVTRSGDLAWFYGGNHRLHMAKVLDLDDIPVRVVVRHKLWQDIRMEVANANSVAELRGEVKRLLPHPDLEGLLPKPESKKSLGRRPN